MRPTAATPISKARSQGRRAIARLTLARVLPHRSVLASTPDGYQSFSWCSNDSLAAGVLPLGETTRDEKAPAVAAAFRPPPATDPSAPLRGTYPRGEQPARLREPG